MVDAVSDGLSVAERFAVMAPHPLARLAFEGCRVPKANLLGQAGRGFQAAMATLDIFRSTVGAAALGFARRALDEATSRVTSRHLFGGPLSDQQITQTALAEMALKIDASALLVYRAAWTRDQGAERVTREAAVEKLYREIRAMRIYEGASEVQKIVIARRHLADQE